MFIPAKSRKEMQGYSWSKEDFREKIILYYNQKTMNEEVLGCLGDWAENTDYVLCKWDSDLLPKLVKKDEIRFTYNQYKNTWSLVSCTIFAAVGMISDLFNYKFTYDEIKEIDELSYTRGRIRGQGWYVQSAVKLVADRWNEKMEKKVAYYRISKYDNEIIEDCINKLYTIDWNYCPTKEYNEDKRDGMLDGTNFWTSTNWHSVDIICKWGQRSVKDSWSSKTNNIYWLKNKLSAITNFWAYFYVYVPVNDNLEEIKRLNDIKSKILEAMPINSELWHLTNSEEYKDKLHQTNEMFREWLEYVNNELKKYS